VKLFLRIAVPVLCLVATIQALSAIYSDNTEVLKAAQYVGCKKECLRTLEVERTPFHQNFVFQVTLDYPIQKIAVTCERELILFGDYSCKTTGPAR
jgi:hypothetical protein